MQVVLVDFLMKEADIVGFSRQIKKQAKGQEVHPRLLELHEKMTDEDNPFLMVAHLKRSI